MINEYAHIVITQDSEHGFGIKISGSADNLLKGLAAAVAQTVKGIPKEHQQEARVIFLKNLNEATNNMTEV